MSLFSVPSRIAVGVRLNIASSAAAFGAAGSDRSDVPDTFASTSECEAVTTSVVSTSETPNVPVSVSVPFVSLMDRVAGPPEITGASFVPVIVIVTVSETESPSLVPTPAAPEPLSSLIVNGYSRTRVSPFAKKSIRFSLTVYSQATWPTMAGGTITAPPAVNVSTGVGSGAASTRLKVRPPISGNVTGPPSLFHVTVGAPTSAECMSEASTSSNVTAPMVERMVTVSPVLFCSVRSPSILVVETFVS